MLENLKAIESDLKTSNQQNKQRMVEFAELSDEAKELRSRVLILTRQMGDKQQELENSSQKAEGLKNELRQAENSRRELETKLQDALADNNRERQARERSEEFSRHLQAKGSNLNVHEENLKREIERIEIEKKELLVEQQTRFNHEVNILREQMTEVELQKCFEMEKLREKFNQEIFNQQECYSAMKKENSRLTGDLELLNDTNKRLQSDQSQIEGDYEELRSKRQAIANWEQQINEIIQWVSDEKDARTYLQALASKMTEELDVLKGSGTLQQNQDKNWRNRRSQKLEKMELLNLQSSLQSEIQAKAQISDELSRTMAELVAAQK